jgi:hypothetical protein
MEHFCEDFVNPWNFHNSETNFQKITTPSSNQKKNKKKIINPFLPPRLVYYCQTYLSELVLLLNR